MTSKAKAGRWSRSPSGASLLRVPVPAWALATRGPPPVPGHCGPAPLPGVPERLLPASQRSGAVGVCEFGFLLSSGCEETVNSHPRFHYPNKITSGLFCSFAEK